MVSKPTGRPRGRPRKAQPTALLMRKRGRPHIPLADHPDRYLLAILSAHIRIGLRNGLSEGHVLETFAGLWFGQPMLTPENVDAMTLGDGYRVWLPSFLMGAESSDWRGKNAFRPLADNWRRTLQKIRTKATDNPDRMWLAAMTLAWEICFLGDATSRHKALQFAGSVGEASYFERKMKPKLDERAVQRAAGADRATEWVPEFLPNLIRDI